jgi:hypothetical protein
MDGRSAPLTSWKCVRHMVRHASGTGRHKTTCTMYGRCLCPGAPDFSDEVQRNQGFWEDLRGWSDWEFKHKMRLSRETFNRICNSLADDPLLQKKKSNFRKPFTIKQRVAVALYFYGQGIGFSALETATGMSDSLISEIVPVVAMVSNSTYPGAVAAFAAQVQLNATFKNHHLHSLEGEVLFSFKCGHCCSTISATISFVRLGCYTFFWSN